ncbi:MAG TPA: hypothetical protein VH165_17610 [Kofleriaceae bacterium]|nr:hypothetical protein [Kofleriaceae bacterium]
MGTAIFVNNDNTTLSIYPDNDTDLAQMGTAQQLALPSKQWTKYTVSRGVYMVRSQAPVQVAPQSGVGVDSIVKDPPPSDAQMAKWTEFGFDLQEVKGFITNSRSGGLPPVGRK